MKGYRFYEEVWQKDRKAEESQGTVIAVLLQENGRGWSPLWTAKGDVCECVSGIYDEPNSPVCSGSVSVDYMRAFCRRISEKRAREIHPKLFEYLEA